MKTHPLFRALLLLFICCLLQTAKGQWVSIPDTNFGMWLNTNGYINCMQGNSQIGWQMDTTCTKVMFDTLLSVAGYARNIHDLTGVQYFDNLKHLQCGQGFLTGLPPLPSGLKTLQCFFNNIQQLPALPNSLKELHASHNALTSLPALPASLTWLDCRKNQLTTIPTLPNGLRVFGCDSNQIASLPALPDSLYDFWCSDNLLTQLPVLPSGLVSINCPGNQLTNLPTLPASLMILTCRFNNLTSLPEFPASLRVIYADNNPLQCLPPLHDLMTLTFANTQIMCLPNYADIDSTNPPLSSLPLCDVFNANGCDISWNINGKVYHDENTNCVYNSSESGLKNISLWLWLNSVPVSRMTSLASGVYSFNTDSYNTYTVMADTFGLPFHLTCPSVGTDSIFVDPFDSLHYDKDFAFECNPGFDLEAHSTVGRFVPANFTTVNISAGDAANFYGARCAAGTSGAVTITFSGPVTYVSPASGALTPTVSGNTLTYNIADFGTVNFFSDFNFVLQTDTNAALGSQVCITVSITPIVGDNDSANNTLTHCFTVVGSFDPNDKTAYPAGDIDTAQEWLTYTVRFQNTGTAEAQHIYITDTLDSNIDVASFQLLAYSHQPMVQIKENAVRFNYPNINLPDSNTNEPESHGYVQYKVKLKENLAIGTQINNTAFIYFDFNEPVITNTTTNTISVISGIRKSEIATLSFEMFPNPAKDVVSVIVDEQLIGAELTVSDITGRNMVVMNIEHRMSNIEVKEFSAGIYFVSITSNGRSSVKRLAVQK